MKPSLTAILVNLALAVSMVVTVAIGVGFALFYHSDSSPAPPPVAAAPPPAPMLDKAAIFLDVPPRPVVRATAPVPPPAAELVAPPTPPPAPAAAPAIVPVAVPSPPANNIGPPPLPAVAPSKPNARIVLGHFEPPPPLMDDEPVAPPPIANGVSIQERNYDAAVVVRQGDIPPPLRTVEIGRHDIHPVPDRDSPSPPVTIVNKPSKPPAAATVPSVPEPKPQKLVAIPAPVPDTLPPPRSATARQLAKGEPPPARGTDMTSLNGHAIVTGALEFNVDGRPLRLFGLKPPMANDVCAPNPLYAARACPDVSREALASLLGPDNVVSCRVVAVGGRAAQAAKCNDQKGTDIASFLVGRGFALADTNETPDYADREKQARMAGAGLWHYR